jgi:Holliday junction resolvasome RuvABC endonuclease subunit
MKADLLISIDPGLVNVGMAAFYSSGQGIITLAKACQLTFQNCPYKKLAYNMWLQICDVTREIEKTMMRPIEIVTVVLEQQHATDTSLKSFKDCLEAVISSRSCEYEIKIKVVSPRTIYAHFKLPRQETWERRKKATKDFVEGKLGAKFPRHDVSDAVALGAGALSTMKVMLRHMKKEEVPGPCETIFTMDDILEDDRPIQEPVSSSSSSSAFGPLAHAEKYKRRERTTKPKSTGDQAERVFRLWHDCTEDDKESEKTN